VRYGNCSIEFVFRKCQNWYISWLTYGSCFRWFGRRWIGGGTATGKQGKENQWV